MDSHLKNPQNKDILLKLGVAFGLLFVVKYKWAKAYIVALILFTFWFFREPSTPVAPDEKGYSIVRSPCYGTVTDIVEDEDGVRFSAFLSVFDPHAQYAPTDSVIIDYQYTPGAFHPAQLYQKTRLNERATAIFRTPDNERIHVTQIAGFIARRILSFVSVGEPLEAGQPYGMIRFGSRVDVSLPKGYQLKVKVGDRLQGPGTVIAWKKKLNSPLVVS